MIGVCEVSNECYEVRLIGFRKRWETTDFQASLADLQNKQPQRSDHSKYSTVMFGREGRRGNVAIPLNCAHPFCIFSSDLVNRFFSYAIPLKYRVDLKVLVCDKQGCKLPVTLNLRLLRLWGI